LAAFLAPAYAHAAKPALTLYDAAQPPFLLIYDSEYCDVDVECAMVTITCEHGSIAASVNSLEYAEIARWLTVGAKMPVTGIPTCLRWKAMRHI
jgi:hypothetical protein